MRLLLISLLLLLFSNGISAQHQHTRSCGYDALLAQKKQDPVWLAKYKDAKKKVKQSLQQRTPVCANPEILPVAIHFSGNVDNSNPACLLSVTQAQIAALNEDFGGYNADIDDYCEYSSNCPADYAPNALAGGACIQFCLATEDHPAGSGLTNGNPAFTFGLLWDGDDDNAPGWEGYINIFVSDVAPPGQPTGLLGIAPNSGDDPDANGIWVGAEYFGGQGVSCSSGSPLNSSGSYNLGRTATHEMGHYFDLAHTFDGCGAGANDGDGISDTPQQDESSGGNPVLNTANCTVTQFGNPHPNTCGVLPMFMNFMDYSNDQSLIMFTSEQSDVMYAYQQLAGTGTNEPYGDSNTKCSAANLAMINYDPTYTDGCPFNEPPVSAFTTDVTVFEFCPLVNEITFTDLSTGFPTGWSWTFSGAGVSPTSSTDQNPTVNVNSTGTLMVSLTASNAAGPDVTPATMNFAITIKPPEECNDCGMSFTDSGGAGGNYSNNENTEYTLCANEGEGITIDFSSVAMAGGFLQDRIRIFDGPTVPSNTNDYLYAVGSSSTLGLNGVWVRPNSSSGSYSYSGTSYSSCSQCVSFLFVSDASGVAAGWEATVSCFTASCSDGMQSPCEEFVDCGGDNCPTCPTACEGFQFTDNGGVNGDMSETMSGNYVICADDATDNVILDFSTISLGATQVLIYEGNVASGQAKYLLQNSTIFINTVGSSYSSIPTAPLESVGQCYTVTHNASGPGITGFVAGVTCRSSLPVELVYWEAIANNNTVELTWETATEINNESFHIYSSDGGYLFEVLTTVKSISRDGKGAKYTYIDTPVNGGKHFYRLEQTDFDGSVSDLGIRSATTKEIDEEFGIYPNPVLNNRLSFTGLSNEVIYNVNIVDTRGEQLKAMIYDATKSDFLNIEDVPFGVYFINVSVGREIFTTKFVKLSQ